jgi:hypothetical protein
LLRELLSRLRTLLHLGRGHVTRVRVTSVGFAEMDGRVYETFDEFVAALNRLRPTDARLDIDPSLDYGRVSEVLSAFQVASVRTDLGFRGNATPSTSAASANNALERTRNG